MAVRQHDDTTLKKGTAELLILAQLENRASHGYEIAQQIEARSRGTVSFHVASLYPILYRLERRGLIAGRWVEKAGPRRVWAMPDFKAFVQKQLSPLALPRHRELKIVEELAAQIEDSYESLIAEGLSDEEAWNKLQQQIPDWKTLGDELLEAEPVIVRLAHPERGPLAGETKRTLMAG